MVNAIDEKLIQELLEKTRDGKLRWTSSADPNEFLTTVRGYSVAVRLVAKRDTYWFLLRDAEDNELMNISDSPGDYDDFPGEEHSALPILCEQARRSALNVGQKVNDLLVELGRL
jgi:hypothetical protein